jgi:SprT-like protein
MEKGETGNNKENTAKQITDEQLTEWIRRISTQSFGKPFRHEARFNPRLRTTGGRYFTKSHDIEINPRQLEQYGIEEVEKIIKHELCHYHLHLEKKGYRHQDEDFKVLLQQVGGSRYCQTLPGAHRTEPYRYLIECQGCGVSFPRKRKFEARKYVCSRCGGRFKVHKLSTCKDL